MKLQLLYQQKFLVIFRDQNHNRLPQISACKYKFQYLNKSDRRSNFGIQAKQKDSEDLLKGVHREHIEEVKNILGKADAVTKNWETQYTDFYSPPIIKDALKCIDQMSDISALAWGGYQDAERARIVIGREEILETLKQDPVVSNSVLPLKIEGNFMFDPATHRDFLGAILGTGIKREKVGDILVLGEFGAQVLTTEEIREYLNMELKQVRSVTVKTSEIGLHELVIPEKKVKEFRYLLKDFRIGGSNFRIMSHINFGDLYEVLRREFSKYFYTSEKSLRLDAVASSGFKCSRAQMSTFIKQGLVRVNYQDVNKAITMVNEGDLISCTGKGRVTVKNVELTKKGRYKVTYQQYIQ